MNLPDYDVHELVEAERMKGCLREIEAVTKPAPLPDTLAPVLPFDSALLPAEFDSWATDVSERMQCPIDYVAVSIMVGLGAVIGKKVGIRPKRLDDGFEVIPNLWGMLIGRPSELKTPAMAQAIEPLKRLEIESSIDFERKQKEFLAEIELMDITAKETKSDARKLVKNGDRIAARALLVDLQDSEPEPPTRKRLIVNDASVEKLGELLNQNPNGLLLERDELSGWLQSLSKEDHTNDRAFYLEAFNGTGRYVYDRIGRGTIDISSVCVSVIGTIQPSRLAPYLSHAIKQGIGDDGFAQRFQLAVYPDPVTKWRYVDRTANRRAREAVNQVFDRISGMETPTPLDGDSAYYTHFDDEAQELFIEWWKSLENEVRSGEIHPAMEAHLTKYRSLLPSLALIIQLAESDSLSVSADAVRKAEGWCDYLKSHADRVYAMSLDTSTTNAKTILKKIKQGKLGERFKQREIQQKCWSGLTDGSDVRKALNLLEDHRYIFSEVHQGATGRPSTIYTINPHRKT